MFNFGIRGVILSIYITALHYNDNVDVKSAFEINNAGYVKIENIDSCTVRPNGRYDYLMIFIKSGKGLFSNGKGSFEVHENQVFLYKPGEPQKYILYSKYSSEMYWIHFGGTEVENILKKLNINENSLFDYDKSDRFVKTINSVIDELIKKDSFYQTKCIANLLSLFVSIGRRTIPEKKYFEKESVSKACLFMSSNYFQQISNQQLAELTNLSLSYFLKVFKEKTNTTPQNYLTICRIENAKNLLKESDYTIRQVSESVGFTDPLYFSKVFKKIVGSTPSAFRKKALQQRFEI